MPAPGPPAPDALAGSSPKAFALAPGQEIVVTGSLPLDATARVRRLSVADPLSWAAILVRRELSRYGVEPPVSIRRGSVSPTASLWAVHDSLPLNVLLAQWVKASDNHGMECVLKRLGAAMTLAPGTFESGAAQVRQYLADSVGVDVSTLSVVDGSGASRYNLVAPAQLTATLQHAAQDFGTGAEMVASLAVGGVDGTVSRRFAGLPQGYRVRAKTGTMTGVSALLGLLEGPGHTPLVFCVMMDGALLPAEGLRKLQDDIVRRIAVGLLP
jgi:D-alanyl-D-alanine carboxypeptidase/D-alanyl-D-alanine-endopeptidase (penicillin-binding protein 4)